MENKPELIKVSESGQESEISFNEQMTLAKDLLVVISEMDRFIVNHGGDFDTFAESFQHVGNLRGEHDQLQSKVSKLKKEFDEKIVDKKQFVNKLRSVNEEELADFVAKLFRVRKDNIFSKIFKK